MTRASAFSTPHPKRRRGYPTALTAKGKVPAACDRLIADNEAEMLSGLSPTEHRQLRDGLIHAVCSLGAGFPEY